MLFCNLYVSYFCSFDWIFHDHVVLVDGYFWPDNYSFVKGPSKYQMNNGKLATCIVSYMESDQPADSYLIIQLNEKSSKKHFMQSGLLILKFHLVI